MFGQLAIWLVTIIVIVVVGLYVIAVSALWRIFGAKVAIVGAILLAGVALFGPFM